jgi:protein TonB
VIGILVRWLPVSLALHGAAFGATLLLPREPGPSPLFVDLTLETTPSAPPPSARGDRAGDEGKGGRAAPRPAGDRPARAARTTPRLEAQAAPSVAPSASTPTPTPSVPPPPVSAPTASPPIPPPRIEAAPAPAIPSAAPAQPPPPAASAPDVASTAAAEGASRPTAESPAAAAWNGAGAGTPSGAASATVGGAGGHGDGRGTSTAQGGGGGRGDGAGEGTLALAVPGDGGGVYAAYLALLRRRVQESVRYPEAARRRSLSGTAHLEIVVEPSGRITDVTVVRSSSHAALDDAAVDGVRALRRVPFPSDVRPRPLRVRLPVVFELR